MENPFAFNPFSTKKVDFTKGIPEAPKEIPEKKKPAMSDDERINAMNNEPKPSKETIVQKIESGNIGPNNPVV
jgi:hypothetical protein